MSSETRAIRVEEIRKEGAQAFRDGVKLDRNPHQQTNRKQWRVGWLNAKADALGEE